MSKVYILNKGPHNYTKAEAFGDLVFVTEGLVNKWDISGMYRTVQNALEDSSPEDHILLVSLSSLCSIACTVFALKHNCLRLLLFRDGEYLERTLFFN